LTFKPRANKRSGVGRPDRKSWDKGFVAWIRRAFLAWLILMPLDAVRFHWSHVPNWLQWVGVLLLLDSFYLFVLVYRANAYLSPAVRVQTERGHTVVSTGPYRYVRHPMYGTAILWLAGTALLLGSWYGLLGALVLIVAFAYRAVHEEETLRAELPGYDEYLARVKHRFIPGLW
jgi:protein-S-isoprenylcysteine O-methyltransferase Ste14